MNDTCSVNTIGFEEHFIAQPAKDGCTGCAGHLKLTNNDPTLCIALANCVAMEEGESDIIWIRNQE